MKKFFIIIFFIIISMLNFAFELSPYGFDKRIDTGEGYQEFIFYNSTTSVNRYKIEVFSNGKKNDISQYVNVYPKVITVKPLGKTKVKVYVKAPPTLPNGEYGFMFGTRSIPIPYLNKSKGGRVAPAISIKTAVNLEMLGYVGEVGNRFNMSNEKILSNNGKKYYTATLTNKNGRGYELGIGFADSANSMIKVNAVGRVNNGKSIKIKEEIPANSKYVVFYDYNNRQVVCQKIQISNIK